MARPRARAIDPAKTPGDGWAGLTWDDLEGWAGSRSVSRGRTYQRGGRVKDLRVSADGDLLATVVGGERYATTVAMRPGPDHPSLESECTCPVGVCCKHAVAVVAEYLQAVADKRVVPVAAPDDPRRAELDDASAEDDQDEEEAGDPWDDEPEEFPVARPRRPGSSTRRKADPTDWDRKIEEHVRGKPRGELADLVWTLVKRFPEIHREFRERIALQEGDVGRLVADARREIRRITAEPAWQNHWSGDGHLPDYSPIRHRFERLLELGHADEVVSLGRDLLDRGLQQVAESHDEGETATRFAEAIRVVFQAATRSSLTVAERLLFAIDAELADGYDALGEATAAVLDSPADPEDWSTVADTLAGRLEAAPARGKGKEDSFSRNFQRDQVTSWVAKALQEAGRAEEVRALYESEARLTGSYERLVHLLLERRRFDDAERWAKEGIAATIDPYPGIAEHLAASLCEVARGRKRWDVVAAHAARPFFDHPNPSNFEELRKAAAKAGVEEPVRAAALHFLETGAVPFRVISPRPAATRPPRPDSRARKRSAQARPSSPTPEPKPTRLEIDPGWPLPMPDYLIPFLDRPNRYGHREPGPHPDVLLEMAIVAGQPDEILRRFDAIRSARQGDGYRSHPSAFADRVAAAVSGSHPERAIEIYTIALNDQLPHARSAAYESAAGYLKKLRPIYEGLGRADEWASLLASIRETYRNRSRFREVLDRLDGRTILQSSRTKPK